MPFPVHSREIMPRPLGQIVPKAMEQGNGSNGAWYRIQIGEAYETAFQAVGWHEKER